MVYNTENSGLPYNSVEALAVDAQGTLWVGTGKFYNVGGEGLAKFDGETWTAYNTDNSGLPNNHIISLTIDDQGNIWMGTDGGGVAKFDGETWTVYDIFDTALSSGIVASLAIDDQANIWMGTDGGGVAKFDGETWTVYDIFNSGLPHNYAAALAFDTQEPCGLGLKMVWRSLTARIGRCMTQITPSCRGNGSGVLSLMRIGNKWIGTQNGGLAVYREGGVMLPDVRAELQ